MSTAVAAQDDDGTVVVKWVQPPATEGRRGEFIGSGSFHNVFAIEGDDNVVRRELNFYANFRTRREYTAESNDLWQWVARCIRNAVEKNPEMNFWHVVAAELKDASESRRLKSAMDLIYDMFCDLGRVVNKLSRTDTAAVIDYIALSPPGKKKNHVVLAAATLRMANMFANGRELLPTVCTNYSDTGVQFITRCMEMESGARAISTVGGADTYYTFSPATVQRLVENFFEMVKRSTAPVFDFKLANIGIEGNPDDEDSLAIRLIDVDADDRVRTYMSVHETAFHFLQRQKQVMAVPIWDKYQTLYTATLAIIQWLSPNDVVFLRDGYPTNPTEAYKRLLHLSDLAIALPRSLAWQTVQNMANHVAHTADTLVTEMSVPTKYMQPFTDRTV